MCGAPSHKRLELARLPIAEALTRVKLKLVIGRLEVYESQHGATNCSSAMAIVMADINETLGTSIKLY